MENNIWIMKVAVEQMCLSKTGFRSPFLFQWDYSQLEKEASSNHLEINWYLKADKDETVLGWDRKNIHLREGRRKGKREKVREKAKGKWGTQPWACIRQHSLFQTLMVPYPFPASRSSYCPHHMAALRTEWQAVISARDGDLYIGTKILNTVDWPWHVNIVNRILL